MKTLITIGILLIATFSFSQTNLTSELEGVEIKYQYSGGNKYNVKFENGTISYRFLTGSRPEKWWGPFAYQASKTENGEYFLSWYEKGYGDYVTLLLNTKTKTIWGSAIIIKGDKSIVHFQKASITEFIK